MHLLGKDVHRYPKRAFAPPRALMERPRTNLDVCQDTDTHLRAHLCSGALKWEATFPQDIRHSARTSAGAHGQRKGQVNLSLHKGRKAEGPVVALDVVKLVTGADAKGACCDRTRARALSLSAGQTVMNEPVLHLRSSLLSHLRLIRFWLLHTVWERARQLFPRWNHQSRVCQFPLALKY